ncbi:hypothetical protein [aff. Roholtiella sp. LEGE 12411]|uniref:hypothetical protein n=1 Tax=aff. Roholtiella sp. LEGE 12411 TaxID=1828822 RepID=UPI00187FB768|nr:hypothetical protein [aff. Roholtiella sp. LEGE 12411]MBE9034168.1 hypothetical protein [aff. Roholtiella sp. LEGE 12411]
MGEAVPGWGNPLLYETLREGAASGMEDWTCLTRKPKVMLWQGAIADNNPFV